MQTKKQYPYKDYKLNTHLVEELKKKIPDYEKRYEFLGKCLVAASYTRVLEEQKDGRYYFGNTSITSKALEGRDLSKIISNALKDKSVLENILHEIKWQDFKEHKEVDRIFSIILLLYSKGKLSYATIGEVVERALSLKDLKQIERSKLNIEYAIKEDLPILRDLAKAKCFLGEENFIRQNLIKYFLKK